MRFGWDEEGSRNGAAGAKAHVEMMMMMFSGTETVVTRKAHVETEAAG